MKNFKNLMLLLTLPFIVLLSDTLIRREVFPNFNQRMWNYYGLSVLTSFILYPFLLFTLNLLFRVLLNKYRILISLIFSLLYSFSLIGSYGYFYTANMLPNYFVINYIIQEPLNSYTLIKDTLSLTSGISFLGLTVFSFYVIYKFSFISLQFNLFKKILILFSGILSISLISIISFNTRYQDQLYVTDVNSLAFLSRNILNRILSSQMGTTGLQSRTRIPIKTALPKSDFNVLLVVAESLRKDKLSLYKSERDTTPFLRSLKSKKQKELFLVQNAFSNASSTVISFPSILTGVSPIQPASDSHSYPIFWEYGKAAGLSTFYITSHSLEWNNFKGYFSNSDIDYLYCRENSGEYIFNDIGIDDRKTLASFKTHIEKLAAGNKNFAGVLHLNTNHFPFLVPETSKVWKGSNLQDMYDSSVYHLDKLLESMYSALSGAGVSDNTIIIITSDHGESLLEHNYMGHIESYYIETVSIPMLFHIPEPLQKKFNIANLESNAEKKNIMNLDLIPTLIDILGSDSSNFQNIKFTGNSLLKEIPRDRTIVIANNNETSIYKVGISYIRNDLHYILKINSIPKKEELYNIKEDPLEVKNLWNVLSPNRKMELRQEIKECPVCSEIFSNL